MRWIDRFAYRNRIRKLNPMIKIGLSLFVVCACLIANWLPVSLIFLLAVFALALLWAGLPAKPFLLILFGESFFLLMGVIGVAVSVHVKPFHGAVSFLGLWIDISANGLTLAVGLFFRSLACTAAMNFLAMTTPLVDLIDVLRQWRIPPLLIDLMTLIYRFIFTLFDCLERMIAAKQVKLGFRDWRTSMRSWGEIGANLFIEAYRHSQKLQMSLESRGWQGDFRVLPWEYETRLQDEK